MIRDFNAESLKGWIAENEDKLQPPVNNKEMFPGSSMIVMMVGGPNRRRDFHVSPAEEFFYQIKGSCYVEIINDEGNRQVVEVKEGDVFMLPANVPHSPHRVADTIGMVIEENRGEGVQESMVWYCENCNHEMHKATMELTDIAVQIKGAIDEFNSSKELRTCNNCGHVMSEEVELWKPE